MATSSSSPLDTEAYDRETERLQKKSERLTRITYGLAVVKQVLTFFMQSVNPCFSANNRIGAAITAVSCLQQYYSTNTGQNWMNGTVVWPTILNALAALIIVIWSGILCIGYCIGGAVEKRLEKHSGLAAFIQNTLTAFATSIMLATAADPASLEGQTCSNTPPTVVNASAFCFKQVHPESLCMKVVTVELLPNGDACSDLVGNVDVRLVKDCGVAPEESGTPQCAKVGNWGSKRCQMRSTILVFFIFIGKFL
jgi:hypothetical protein